MSSLFLTCPTYFPLNGMEIVDLLVYGIFLSIEQPLIYETKNIESKKSYAVCTLTESMENIFDVK